MERGCQQADSPATDCAHADMQAPMRAQSWLGNEFVKYSANNGPHPPPGWPLRAFLVWRRFCANTVHVSGACGGMRGRAPPRVHGGLRSQGQSPCATKEMARTVECTTLRHLFSAARPSRPARPGQRNQRDGVQGGVHTVVPSIWCRETIVSSAACATKKAVV